MPQSPANWSWQSEVQCWGSQKDTWLVVKPTRQIWQADAFGEARGCLASPPAETAKFSWCRWKKTAGSSMGCFCLPCLWCKTAVLCHWPTPCCALRTAEPRLPFAEGWPCLAAFGKWLFLHRDSTRHKRSLRDGALSCISFHGLLPLPLSWKHLKATFSVLLVKHIKILNVPSTYTEISLIPWASECCPGHHYKWMWGKDLTLESRNKCQAELSITNGKDIWTCREQTHTEQQ